MRSPITILLAEDNPGDVFLIRRALEKHGLVARLEVVEEGQAAIRYLDAMDADPQVNPPDIALLDLNLPRASGSRILARIRQSPRCASIPAIIVTSSDSPLDRDSAAKLGATAYFQKPGDLIGFMQLGQVVRNALETADGSASAQTAGL